MSHEAATVCAVTVTYGSRFDLCRGTVASALLSGVDHVVVVDNGSSDSKLLVNEFLENSSVSIVHMDANLGSAGGFSAGIMASIQRPEEYVLLLDDDNLLVPDSLAAALRFYQEIEKTRPDGRIAVSCMRTSNPLHRKVAQGLPARTVYPRTGAFMTFDLIQRVSARFRRPDRGVQDRRPEPAVIPVAPYGGLLLKRADLKRLGGPDPRLTLYEDDTAWTHSLAQRGYDIWLCVDAPIEDADAKWHESDPHARGPLRLLRAADSVRLYYSVRNRVIFDFGRAKGPVERARYYLNRTAFFAYVRYAGRGPALATARKVFFTAVAHGEKRRLDLGPTL